MMYLVGYKGDAAVAVPPNRHPGMFLAGIQWLKTLDACIRRHDVNKVGAT